MRVLGHAGESFRSATPGVVRAPVQDGAVRDVGGRRARVHVANWNHPWPWPLAAPLPRHLDRVLKSLSDFRRWNVKKFRPEELTFFLLSLSPRRRAQSVKEILLARRKEKEGGKMRSDDSTRLGISKRICKAR